ncbi:unnamed protein product [Protopolystoma xenopodis]|uniref:Uncharacterized protein n=1 Tax=Protopolystoma xenopodis TaxID=117903 RepID=A0A448WMI9_9PLAT|nr:unnamed protein product [Protopolystoma xenopodis]
MKLSCTVAVSGPQIVVEVPHCKADKMSGYENEQLRHFIRHWPELRGHVDSMRFKGPCEVMTQTCKGADIHRGISTCIDTDAKGCLHAYILHDQMESNECFTFKYHKNEPVFCFIRPGERIQTSADVPVLQPVAIRRINVCLYDSSGIDEQPGSDLVWMLVGSPSRRGPLRQHRKPTKRDMKFEKYLLISLPFTRPPCPSLPPLLYFALSVCSHAPQHEQTVHKSSRTT